MPVFKIPKLDLRETSVILRMRASLRRTRFISFIIFIIFSLVSRQAVAQRDQKILDSLENIVQTTDNDSVKVVIMRRLISKYNNLDAKKAISIGLRAVALAKRRELELELGRSYQSLGISYAIGGKADSSIWAFEQAVPIFQKLDEKSLAAIYVNIGATNLFSLNNYEAGLKAYYKARQITEKFGGEMYYIFGGIAETHQRLGNDKLAIEYHLLAIKDAEKRNNPNALMLLRGNLAGAFIQAGRLEEAKKILIECIAFRKERNDKFFLSNHYIDIGKIYQAEGDYDKAYNNYYEALKLKKEVGGMMEIAETYERLGNIDFLRNNISSAKRFALRSLHLADSLKASKAKRDASELLARISIYQHDIKSSIHYDSLKNAFQDVLNIEEQRKATAEIKARYEIEKKEQENEVLRIDQLRHQTELANQRYVILMIAVILIAVIVLLIVVSRSRQLFKKAHDLLKNKNEAIGLQHEEIISQKQQIDRQMEELKITQSQLVQSEKMASLGQMTSGIAHEINNPLNFISGGVEGLKHSVDTLLQYAKKPKTVAEEELTEIEKEVKGLMTNINNGVGRANKIITSLRTFSSPQGASFSKIRIVDAIEVALTMMNHKILHKGIKVTVSAEDERSIVGNTSELCQVFSNLIDNAIYAMEDQLSRKEIFIKTESSGDNVIVKIADTGPGIPQNIQTKILEPFFTTKPVGRGTGLGLSISYAIIEKHRGRLSFRSEEGMGTEFKLTFTAVQLN